MEESLPIIEQFLNNLTETNKAELQDAEQYSCNECNYMTEDRKCLPVHKKEHHKQSNIGYIEESKYMSGDAMTLVEEATKVNIYTCNQCDYCTESEDVLNNHRQSVHPEKLYPCEDCRKRMESEEGIFYPCTSCTSNLVKAKKKEKVMKFKCDKCDYKAGKVNHLTQHKQSKHTDVAYSCDKCDYKASIKGNLSQHKQAEHEGIRYSCKVCGYEAKKMGHLMHHKKIKHMSF
eukprot:GFUD01139079.1.p1 GENE.GFUD01139079.1~~GFUD01139079.1.p1  ORF type:complete len:248 (+),score=55.27 GFUD01139079.1:49-744(+)